MGKEIWRQILGYEGLYLISNHGRVKRGVKEGPPKLIERVRVPYKHKSDYLSVNLSNQGRSSTKYLHKLVAEAFLPNPQKKPHVIHKNLVKTDNCYKNLQWATLDEVWDHQIKNNRRKGESANNVKLTSNQVLRIKQALSDGRSINYLAKQYLVTYNTIYSIKANINWKHVKEDLHG